MIPPIFASIVCVEYPLLLCLLSTISETNERYGCMDILRAVCVQKRMNVMLRTTEKMLFKICELGIKSIIKAVIIVPASTYGIRLPHLVHVRSLMYPTIGCIINPARGGASHSSGN